MELAFLAPGMALAGGCTSLAQYHSPRVFIPSRRRRVAMAMRGTEDNGSSPGQDAGKNGKDEPKPEVYRKGSERKWKGDEMPFDVRVISPPPRLLGRFHLHPRTGRGDVIEMGEASYVVKRVRSHFVWAPGGGGQAGPKLTKKTVETVSMARKSIEMGLEKAFHES